jgi:hypothetical protein
MKVFVSVRVRIQQWLRENPNQLWRRIGSWCQRRPQQPLILGLHLTRELRKRSIRDGYHTPISSWWERVKRQLHSYHYMEEDRVIFQLGNYPHVVWVLQCAAETAWKLVGHLRPRMRKRWLKKLQREREQQLLAFKVLLADGYELASKATGTC